MIRGLPNIGNRRAVEVVKTWHWLVLTEDVPVANQAIAQTMIHIQYTPSRLQPLRDYVKPAVV